MRYLLVLLLAGCASQQGSNWEKRGATAEDWNMDSGQCRAQAFSYTPIVNARTVMIFESCLQGKGWYKTQSSQ